MGYDVHMSTRRIVPGRSEYAADPIKGSRFVATVVPIDTSEQARAVVSEVQRRWPQATHHCWGYRLVDGVERSSDDGEPGGSAGRPILAQIVGHEVAGVVVVVTRWYGGTKLGVGGLIRAYGGTAGKALDRAEIEEIELTIRVLIVHAYGDTGPVAAVLSSFGLEVANATYEADVRLDVLVPVARHAEL
ncbi:MAG: putative YigZ family protein, partial [Kiritimatiellia bacterium]